MQIKKVLFIHNSRHPLLQFPDISSFCQLHKSQRRTVSVFNQRAGNIFQQVYPIDNLRGIENGMLEITEHSGHIEINRTFINFNPDQFANRFFPFTEDLIGKV